MDHTHITDIFVSDLVFIDERGLGDCGVGNNHRLERFLAFAGVYLPEDRAEIYTTLVRTNDHIARKQDDGLLIDAITEALRPPEAQEKLKKLLTQLRKQEGGLVEVIRQRAKEHQNEDRQIIYEGLRRRVDTCNNCARTYVLTIPSLYGEIMGRMASLSISAGLTPEVAANHAYQKNPLRDPLNLFTSNKYSFRDE